MCVKPAYPVWGSLGIGLFAWAAVFSLRLNPVLDVSPLEQRAPAAARSARASGPPALYEDHCGSCHGPSGEGRYPVFPPLASSPHVTGDPKQLLGAVLDGLSGPIEVNGVAYDGYMPAFEGRMSDEELAALLSYVRSSWGNRASAISRSDVQAYREVRSLGVLQGRPDGGVQ